MGNADSVRRPDPQYVEFASVICHRDYRDDPSSLDGQSPEGGWNDMKRVFGRVEAVFDILYLAAATIIGVVLLVGAPGNPPRFWAGVMALLLVGGDAFHLIPRIRVILSGDEESNRRALGRGKQITSITMTLFYVILYHIGTLIFAIPNAEVWAFSVCLLAMVRIALCFLPQNRWTKRYPPVRWGILRNVPFFALGATVAAMFFVFRKASPGLGLVWLALILSFAFYLPVVLWANRNPKIGMLMLPKTAVYVWLLIMCLSL